MGTFTDILKSTAPNILGAGMGLLLEGHNDRRQLRQQGKLQNLQIAGQKELTDYNFAKQLQMWKETNYSAQMEQLTKAGLNPGLIYGMSGGGGTTTGNAGTGGVSGANAPSGGREIMDLSAQLMQRQMMQTQIDLTKAQTQKTQAEATKISGIDTAEAATRIQSLTQGIQNQKAQETLTKIQARLTNISAELADDTLEDAAQQIKYNVQKSAQEIQQLQIQNNIDQATAKDKIAIVHTEAIGALLTNILTQAKTKETYSNIEVNKQQILTMATKIQQDWTALALENVKVVQGQQTIDQRTQEIAIQKFKAELDGKYPGLWDVIGGNVEGAINGIFKAFGKDGRPAFNTIKP